MSDLVRFLGEIGPALFRLGLELYEAFTGDSDEAIRDIEDRTEEIATRRAQRRAELDAKFPPEE